MTDDSPAPVRSGFDYLIRSTLAGGIAGGVAKTAVAPLDRVKILFQTHSQEFARFSGSLRGIFNALKHIVETQGFRGIGYTVYDSARKVFISSEVEETSIKRLIAGSVAGISVLPLTYPFEVVRVRMAVETKHSNTLPSILSTFRGIYKEPSSHLSPLPLPFRGLAHFYRGFTVTALGTVPYRGGIFLVWETLNAHARAVLQSATLDAHRNGIHLAVGAFAGAAALVVTYPLEVIRRVQQAGLSAAQFPGDDEALAQARTRLGGSPQSLGVRETARWVWQTSGWRGYYAGLGAGLLKQVPMHSISLSTWQAAKRVLDV